MLNRHFLLIAYSGILAFVIGISNSARAQNLTSEEVSKHNSRGDCWIVIDDKVYDVTSYISRHPASPDLIASRCGKDATDSWKTKGGAGRPHSAYAAAELEKYLKGVIKREAVTDRSR